jgi:hypothetical protein
MSKNRDRGKSYERWIAQDLGGRRVGILGQHDVEITSPPIAVECKERQRMPTFMRKTMQQAIDNCPDDKLPIAIVHELNMDHGKDIVLCQYNTFRLLIGRR